MGIWDSRIWPPDHYGSSETDATSQDRACAVACEQIKLHQIWTHSQRLCDCPCLSCRHSQMRRDVSAIRLPPASIELLNRVGVVGPSCKNRCLKFVGPGGWSLSTNLAISPSIMQRPTRQKAEHKRPSSMPFCSMQNLRFCHSQG